MRFLVLFLIVSYDSSLLTLPVVCSVSVFAHRRLSSSEKRPTFTRKVRTKTREKTRCNKARRKSKRRFDGRSEACVFSARK